MEARSKRDEEEQFVAGYRSTEGSADLMVSLWLLAILNVSGCRVIRRVKDKPPYRCRLQGTSTEVVVSLTAEDAATGFGDGADDASERAAVLRREPRCFYLYFLDVLEYGVQSR